MPDLPPAAVEAAAKALDKVVPNGGGVLWEYDEVMDDATGQTMKRPVTLTDAAKEALRAAYPAIAEHLREQIADEIQDLADGVGRTTTDSNAYARMTAYEYAARIVREGRA